MSGPAARRGDEGSVLLLVLGLVVLAALLITVVIDASALFLDRRELIAAVDGAALAGAQAIDERSVYVHGLPTSGPLTLDEDRVQEVVRSYLSDNGVLDHYDKVQIQVDTTPTIVTVRLTAVVELPVVNAVTPGAIGGVHVTSSATARTAVID